MSSREYFTQRLDDQIDRYDRKSQQAFKPLRVNEIVAVALIPFLAGHAADIPNFDWIAALLGVLTTVIAGLLPLYRSQDNGTNYRSTCEMLRRERFLY